jgi:hypothetical protein
MYSRVEAIEFFAGKLNAQLHGILAHCNNLLNTGANEG